MRADESWQIKTKQFYIAPTIPYRGPHTLVIEQNSVSNNLDTAILQVCKSGKNPWGCEQLLTEGNWIKPNSQKL